MSREDVDAAVEAFTAEIVRENARIGFFKLRLVRGGPWVGAHVVKWDDGTWQAEVDGGWCSPADEDPAVAGGVARVITRGREITEAEYKLLAARAAWARLNAPDRPEANPERPIDRNRLASIF